MFIRPSSKAFGGCEDEDSLELSGHSGGMDGTTLVPCSGGTETNISALGRGEALQASRVPRGEICCKTTVERTVDVV